MIWFSLVVGVILGCAFESLPLGVVFTIIGGLFGLIFNHIREKQTKLITSLQKRLEKLQAQNVDLHATLQTIEERINEITDTGTRAQTSAPESVVHIAAETSSETVETSESIAVPRTITEQEPLETDDLAAATKTEAAAETIDDYAPSYISYANVTEPKTVEKTAKPVVPPKLPTPPGPPSALQVFVQRWVIGGNPLVKIGVLILFLGLAFLLRYASEYIVVPVELRYAGVAAVGVALLVFGWRLRLKKDNYGLILQGAGVAVMYLTPFAAISISKLLPPEMGFVLLVAVALLAALLAVLQDSLAMAMVGTLGGFAAPVLISTGQDAHFGFFVFLTLLNLGIATIAWFKAWRVLNLVGFTCTFTLASGWAHQFYKPALFSDIEPFVLLFFILYVLITFLFARRVLNQLSTDNNDEFGLRIRESVSKLNYVDGTLLFGVPFVCFAMQYLLVQPFANGAAFSALGFGLFYAALALLVFRQSGTRYILLTETLLALGVLFGSVAIPLGLDQTWTSAAWAVEAAGVYWIGIRQQRLHGRAFSLLVLLAAALTSLHAFHTGTNQVLAGSSLGCLMLAGSAAWISWLQRSKIALIHIKETESRPWILVLGTVFFALTPFTLMSMQWASPSLAVMGMVLLFLAIRWAERLLQAIAWIYQILAGALFITTLHSAGSGTALQNGVTGMFTVSLIGISMLISAWLFVRKQAAMKQEEQTGKAGFGAVASVGLLIGITFLNVAPLFVLPWHYAAMIWPLSGVLTLWWATRMRHFAAMLLALALQIIAGLTHMLDAAFSTTALDNSASALQEHLKPFMHSGFLGPILISLAAFVCARMLQVAAHSGKATEGKTNTTLPGVWLGALALLWSVAWWSFGWVDEIYRVAAAHLIVVALLSLTIGSTLLWQALARRWRWQELGLMTLLYLPCCILIALNAFLSGNPHPLYGWNMLAWPLALLMHGFLLRKQTAWVNPELALSKITHIVGAWLFIVLAALELRWRFANLGDADSAWPLLGWMIVPVAYLLTLTGSKVQQAWPVREQRNAYLLISTLPVVAYLICWTLISNVISSGNASPLPYVPVLNPLEIAQLGVLLGMFLWFWPLRAHPALRSITSPFIGVVMVIGLAVLTGMVARTCHHWGSVAWNIDDMLGSYLFQTALSIVWSMVAISTMLIGNRSKRRWVWIAGAALIAVVVAKLFLVELAAKGSLARIVSFIVVGLLLLVVGYFAPLPPRRQIVAAEKSGNENLPTKPDITD